MTLSILSLFPEVIWPYLQTSILKRAAEKGLVTFQVVNPRDFATDKHRKADDSPFGGGPGMVLKPEPFFRAWESVHTEAAVTLATSPVGPRLDAEMVKAWAAAPHLIILAGHYEGFDERLLEKTASRPVSLGDFVLTGGELPALAIVDAVIRWLPGVLGNDASAAAESFEEGLLEHATYTRPATWQDLDVPPVLLSGHHADIEDARHLERISRTWRWRPDLLVKRGLTERERAAIRDFVNEDLQEIPPCTE